MDTEIKPVRVLYSFPHKLGAARIATTAWHQVDGAAKSGAKMTVFTGSICKPLPDQVTVHTTLAWNKLRLPYRVLGSRRTCELHDWIVSRKLKSMVGQVDVVHTWPLGALHTLRIAKRYGIHSVLERPNAHTQFAYEVVQKECQNLGISMPPGHEHSYNASVLKHEKAEYELADHLLCPSDFVVRTFRDKGFSADKLVRHQYGFDNNRFYPGQHPEVGTGGLIILYAGGCAPRKGLHYALDAWLQSTAHEKGTFLIAGGFIPGYAEHLSAQLAHPSVKVLGHRNDIPELMRQSDALVLSSIEEGSALVTSEARGSGCVLLVSDASGAICRDGENALVHSAGDVRTLSHQMDALDNDRTLLARLRDASLKTAPEITWEAAGKRLTAIYQKIAQSEHCT